MLTIEEINHLPKAEAHAFFMQCCTAETWVEKLINTRPFSDLEQLKNIANDCWLDLTEQDYLQAFEGHPKIGDVGSLRKKYASTEKLASGEQQSVQAASEQTLNNLASGNASYEDKFGFIFIVCATGKSAQQMLDLLNQRIDNDRKTELVNASEQQRKIFQIRLDKCTENKCVEKTK